MGRLQRKARQVEESLRATLDEAFGSRIHKRIGVFVGHAAIHSNPQMRVERLVYRALRQAIGRRHEVYQHEDWHEQAKRRQADAE